MPHRGADARTCAAVRRGACSRACAVRMYTSAEERDMADEPNTPANQAWMVWGGAILAALVAILVLAVS